MQRRHASQMGRQQGWTPDGRTYYVSPGGEDNHDGTAPERAWRTVDRASSAAIGPGSRILFEGGHVFQGTLELDEHHAGTAEQPVIVGSYGEGRAVLDAGDGYGVIVRNGCGIRIDNLDIRGSGPARNLGSGIAFENDRPGNVKLEYVRIDGVDVHGFGYHGVAILGKNGKSGFRDVRLTHIRAYDNALSGITLRGQWERTPTGYAHENVYIGHSCAHHNPGTPGPERPHSGSGIVMSDVDRGVIEHSVACSNGELCDSTEGGPVGIWTWDSNAILIQFNVSCRNRTSGPHDGGGFDLDGGVSNSLVQYNLSYENDGAGYLLTHFPFGRPHANNIVRHNISWSDGRRNGSAGIKLAGAIVNASVESNSVFMAPAACDVPSAIAVFTTRLRSPAEEEVAINTRIRKNVFQAIAGASLVRVHGEHPGLLFEDNAYLAQDGPLKIDWRGVTCTTLDEWRSVVPDGDATAKDTIIGGDGNPNHTGRGAVRDHERLLSWLSSLSMRAEVPTVGVDPDLRRFFLH